VAAHLRLGGLQRDAVHHVLLRERLVVRLDRRPSLRRRRVRRHLDAVRRIELGDGGRVLRPRRLLVRGARLADGRAIGVPLRLRARRRQRDSCHGRCDYPHHVHLPPEGVHLPPEGGSSWLIHSLLLHWHWHWHWHWH